MNLGSGGLCVDRQPLARGEGRVLTPGQLLGLARPEATAVDRCAAGGPA
eukprot:CAMPEP_0179207294 /NCGR_PEP_ID=MMETSP0796-20121207/103365_1 /TAXON_ID=73915 /ORGANISM="Pyrodinium bahamense, Strain pbaha01" /LENGTH=48 /DNA_ID= /DNA_START= /DNA_END= /DNA_ORIENTATION=